MLGEAKLISNDNDNSPTSTVSYPFTQFSCLFYNVNHPAESGVVGAGNVPYIHQGCLVKVNLGNIYNEGKIVQFSGGITPTFWYIDNGFLYFQMPFGVGGVPVTFKVSGEGACYDRNLSFYVISQNGRNSYVANPNPVADILNIAITKNIESEKNTLKDYEVKIFEMNSSNTICQNIYKKVSDNLQINMSGFKAGYYSVQIVEGGETHVLKILKL